MLEKGTLRTHLFIWYFYLESTALFTMNISPQFVVLLLSVALVNAGRPPVSCRGRVLAGKRGRPGTELVVSPPNGEVRTWNDCHSHYRNLCQENRGNWKGCMSFDMERWGKYQRTAACKCYGYREQDPELVEPNNNNYFVHVRCKPF